MAPAPTDPRASLPRRDRLAILAALSGVTLLAWLYLFVAARGMESMGDSSLAGMHGWSAVDFALMLAMWVVMMIGMMVPSAAPMVLLYAAVARRAAAQRTPLASTAVFAAGYLAAWSLFGVAATGLQWLLERAALLSPMLVATSPALGAGLLIGAGAYQLTPAKEACLRHCRAPAHFLSQHWRRGAWGAFRMGLAHGAFCLGCCWVLMGLLFFGGVMNLLWIAAITAFVLVEKLLPRGALVGRLAGAAMIAAGAAALAGWWPGHG